jgi:hypothetical protein
MRIITLVDALLSHHHWVSLVFVRRMPIMIETRWIDEAEWFIFATLAGSAVAFQKESWRKGGHALARLNSVSYQRACQAIAGS